MSYNMPRLMMPLKAIGDGMYAGEIPKSLLEIGNDERVEVEQLLAGKMPQWPIYPRDEDSNIIDAPKDKKEKKPETIIVLIGKRKIEL